MQPIAPGHTSLEVARASLVDAQGFAANVANAPESNTLANLSAGISAAAKSAAELFSATPRSEYQDLGLARTQVLEGKQLLEQAILAFESEIPAEAAFANVKQLAGDAFDAFEGAFEIIDND